MHEIKFTEQALQDIKGLPKFIKKQIQATIDRIVIDPRSEAFELYRDLKGLWSCHIGDYRIVYEIGQVIIVYGIGHRKDIYISSFLQQRAEEMRKKGLENEDYHI
ncbi:MAG: type II toxin-antitoxin system RelE/ParE family toxin [Firmicutes bacterium]|nr:type II toxin-antitoxin system RelE/ParE family toxin [Bacillota bacterium]